jgi:hypothetical protein
MSGKGKGKAKKRPQTKIYLPARGKRKRNEDQTNTVYSVQRRRIAKPPMLQIPSRPSREEYKRIQEEREPFYRRYKALDEDYKNECNFSDSDTNIGTQEYCTHLGTCVDMAENIALNRLKALNVAPEYTDWGHINAILWNFDHRADPLRNLYHEHCPKSKKLAPRKISKDVLDVLKTAIHKNSPVKKTASTRLNRYNKIFGSSSFGATKKQERIISIKVSTNGSKKYMAKVKNKTTGRIRTIHFGARSYAQYKDSTRLKKYARKNHLNAKRRQNYFKRHSGVTTKQKALAKEWKKSRGKYNAKILSHTYLW